MSMLSVEEISASLRRIPTTLPDAEYNLRKLEQLKSRVVIDPSGCWLYQGTKHNGYTVGSYRGKSYNTSRVMWLALKGPIPDGLHVCHTCDVRHCVNPDHLWLGTNRENITDMVKKGRGPCGEKATRTHCKHGHEFAVHGYSTPSHPTWRRCRECDRIKEKTNPKYAQWRRAYQRMKRNGWSKEEAFNTPAIPAGTKTARRSSGRAA